MRPRCRRVSDRESEGLIISTGKYRRWESFRFCRLPVVRPSACGRAVRRDQADGDRAITEGRATGWSNAKCLKLEASWLFDIYIKT